MGKTIHFVSGLPRSCSTLLCNLLAQNPRVHATATSPLHEIGYAARRVFETGEAKSIGGDAMEKMFLDYVRAGCEHAFDSITDRPVVADKARSWIGFLDQTFNIWPNAKILVPVRDIRGVLTSMERIHRQHPSPMKRKEATNPFTWSTTERRVQGWLNEIPVGIAITRLGEAASRFKDRLFFVHAEELTSAPSETMRRVWEYLGEEPFEHDFDHVDQYTHEVEIGFPYGDHTIRHKVEPIREEWDAVLGVTLSETIRIRYDWVNKL
jgi:sulfotransferase